MRDAQQMHRQCVDCYYNVAHSCRAADSLQNRHGHDSNETCEHFVRASLHYAFFPKL